MTLQQLKYIVAIDRWRKLPVFKPENLEHEKMWIILQFMPEGMMDERIAKYGIRL